MYAELGRKGHFSSPEVEEEEEKKSVSEEEEEGINHAEKKSELRPRDL